MNNLDLTFKEGAVKAGRVSVIVLAGIGVLALVSSVKKLRDMYRGRAVNEAEDDGENTEEN